jgi:Protein of unknown function (DUF4230)
MDGVRTSDGDDPAHRRRSVSPRTRNILLVLALIAGGAILGTVLIAGRIVSAVRGLVDAPGSTSVTHAVVVERMRAVSRLVTSETTLRDVVVYQNRRLGSTKRSLVVVTGRVLTGFDLDRGTEVQVDHDARRVRIQLPAADVLGVEVTGLRTYDEQRGLWNPFRPADRDTIFQLAREQLVRTAGELEVRAHAEESARRLLEALVSADGYSTEVTFSGSAGAREDG